MVADLRRTVASWNDNCCVWSGFTWEGLVLALGFLVDSPSRYLAIHTVSPEQTPIVPNTRTEPILGLLDRAAVVNMPAAIGPNPLAMLPPSMDNPFMVPRCSAATVRFVAMVILEKKTSPKMRMNPNKTAKNKKADHVRDCEFLAS